MDKYLFLHFYRKPPHYSSNMCVRASRLTAFPGLLIHLAMSLWMLGNKVHARTHSREGAACQDVSSVEHTTMSHCQHPLNVRRQGT